MKNFVINKLFSFALIKRKCAPSVKDCANQKSPVLNFSTFQYLTEWTDNLKMLEFSFFSNYLMQPQPQKPKPLHLVFEGIGNCI